MTWTFPALSVLNSPRPAFTSFTAFAVSSVTVPVFGFGIRPRGPSTLPSLRTSIIASGVAIATSKSVQPPTHLAIMSSKPTFSAPADLAASAALPLAKTRTRTVLPLPCGSGTVPRTIWSDCFGSTPRRNARSIVSLNFAFGNFARTPTASLSGYAFFASTTSSAFLNRLLGILFGAVHASFWLSRDYIFNLTDNFNSHAARRSRNDAERRFFVRRVHVLGLHLDDVQNLLARHLADFVLVRNFRTGGDARSFLQKN